MTRRLPVRRLPPFVIDGLLAAFFTVLAQVELHVGWDDGYRAGPLWLNSALQVLVTMPLVLRSSRPRLCFGLMAAAVAVPALVVPRTILFWGNMLPLMLVVFTVARARRRWWQWAAPVAALAGASVALRNDEMPFSDAVFGIVMFGAAQVTGQLVGRISEQRGRLSVALAQLAAEQDQREEHAVHEERRRIAAEMHDVIAHAVSLMTIQLGAARLRLETTGQCVPDELRSAEETGRRALGELRRTLGVMRAEGRTGSLQPLPGLADMPTLVERFRTGGVNVSLRVDVAADLPDSIQLAAYRIVQESLTNVIRHAGDVACDVRICQEDDELVVGVVNDSGRIAAPSGGGHGLTGMRERVSMFAGTLTAEATGDGGFAVVARIPVVASGSDAYRTGARR
jgi:signal transduction histidine kinase